MERDEFFTTEEKELLFSLYRKLLQLTGETLQKGDCRKLKTHLINSIKDNRVQRDTFGLNPLIKDMQTAVIVGRRNRNETGVYSGHHAARKREKRSLYPRRSASRFR